ncbi:MAG: leucyl aminopeptidase [candidate division Zixibacteria bacterium CG_4_9_14_3_um_filter_46_8]|nr:MAG: leucyl aminopeptidase [candidate division Zixibacteria bacterium CG_4_9_14_3_um_filter_46_8]
MAKINIGISKQMPGSFKGEWLILLLSSDSRDLSGEIKELDAQYGNLISGVFASGEFKGKTSEIYKFNLPQGLPVGRMILSGIGPKSALDAEIIRKSAAAAVRLTGSVSGHIGILLPVLAGGNSVRDYLSAGLEGALLSLYRFDKYKSKDKDNVAKRKKVSKITILLPGVGDPARYESVIKETESICNAVYYGRDLINLPGNEFSTQSLVDEARKLGKHPSVKIEILRRDKLKKMGMKAILAVGGGSQSPPFLIVIEYRGGRKGERPLALIGKGVTFDSGGITLKDGPKMEEMKQDMAGAAVVISTISAIAQLKIPINIIALVPAVENMPSGKSYRPGDIIRTHSGITVEVLSTDAEGRLIIADALSYSKRFNPTAVIDIATLTGAARIALGTVGCAVLGHDDDLVGKIIDASARTGEKVWRLPLWPEFDKRLESYIADLKNTGGSDGGTIVAGKFLSKFIEGYRWAHLDIANVDYAHSDGDYWREGATGFGIRLLIDVVRNWK